MTVNANLNRLSLPAPRNWVQKNGAKRRSPSSANWFGWSGSVPGGTRAATSAWVDKRCSLGVRALRCPANLTYDVDRAAEAVALEPAEHRVDRDRFDAIAEALLVRMVVEGDVGAGHAGAETLEGRNAQGRRLVA